MPLCSVCRAEGLAANGTIDGPLPGREIGDDATPPYGMEWGQSCDRCTRAAEVTVRP